MRLPRASHPCELHLIADDFGRSLETNAAIAEAHRRGTLTGASLMVAGPAFADAVERAKEMPNLRVGLHLVVAGGRACLPPEEVPDLVDRTGLFPASPVTAGLRYALLPRAHAQLGRELRAQFERFAQTGLRLAHVDGHMHMHLHPVVFRLLEPLLIEYGVPRVRMPRDELVRALAWDHRHLARKIAWAAVFGVLGHFAARRLARLCITVAERTYGLFQSGQMAEPYVARLLGQLHVRSAEIYFHPTTGMRLDSLGPNPTDMATLVSPRIRRLIRQARKGNPSPAFETIEGVPRNKPVRGGAADASSAGA